MSSEKKNLSELLNDLLTSRALTPEKLSLATNIPRRFINSLLAGEYRNLPSKPYIHGYLIKISMALDVDPEMLLQSYKASTELPSSGKRDQLPENRFAVKPVNRNLIIGAVIILLTVGIIIFRFNDIVGTPYLEVNVPTTSSSEILQVTGKVKSGDRVTLNGEVVYPQNDGTFEKDVLLNTSGPTTLEFTVKRFLGRQITITRQVMYQPNNQ